MLAEFLHAVAKHMPANRIFDVTIAVRDADIFEPKGFRYRDIQEASKDAIITGYLFMQWNGNVHELISSARRGQLSEKFQSSRIYAPEHSGSPKRGWRKGYAYEGTNPKLQYKKTH